MTTEDAQYIKENLAVLEAIDKNKSISGAGIELRSRLNAIGARNGWNFCTTCNAGFFRVVSLCLENYRKYEKEQGFEKRSSKANRRESKGTVHK